MTKHTPGPWIVNPDTFNPERSHSIEAPNAGEVGNIVAEVCETPGSDVDLADARLIAAAPEILEAAEDAERLLGTLHDKHVETRRESWDTSDRPKAVAKVRHRLRAAIDKATGEE